MTTLHAQLPYLDKGYNDNLAIVAWGQLRDSYLRMGKDPCLITRENLEDAMLSIYRARILAERARRLRRGQELARIIAEQISDGG